VDVRNDLRLFGQPLTARATAAQTQFAPFTMAMDDIDAAAMKPRAHSARLVNPRRRVAHVTENEHRDRAKARH